MGKSSELIPFLPATMVKHKMLSNSGNLCQNCSIWELLLKCPIVKCAISHDISCYYEMLSFAKNTYY